MTVNLKFFSKSDIKDVYDVEYGILADRTWMAFNGPYFRDSIPT